MPNPDRLRAFIRNFYGYGSWTADLWFIGMEEGGGETLGEIARRLDAWSGAELEDLRDFHLRFGATGPFGDRPRIQATWGKLIRAALCAQGRTCDTEAVRDYQRHQLGRSDGTTALIELFPLPSPSTRHWTYGDCGVPEIATREAYREALTESRVTAIQRRIDVCKPHAVIFYGLAYREYWTRIAGTAFTPAVTGRSHIAQRGPSHLFLAPHPTAPGVRNDDFCSIGRLIASTRA